MSTTIASSDPILVHSAAEQVVCPKCTVYLTVPFGAAVNDKISCGSCNAVISVPSHSLTYPTIPPSVEGNLPAPQYQPTDQYEPHTPLIESLWPERELLDAAETNGGCTSGIKQLFSYNGIFGCHHHTQSCVQTLFCPCYTVYKNTDYAGNDGLVAGGAWLALTAVHPGLGSIIPAISRGKIRSKVTGQPEEKRQIKDVAVHCLCPLFGLCQEARLIKQAQSLNTVPGGPPTQNME